MSYPLTVRFKKIAIARQLAVTDPDDRLLMYVKQKAFKLKEAITVYADREQTKPLYRIAADRVIDFSATYEIRSEDGEKVGAVRRRGMKTLWRARYDIMRDDDVVFTAREENPWAKVGDRLFEGIPVVGILSGYVFHPRYLITAEGQGDVVRVRKRPALLETAFRVDRLETPLSPQDEQLLLIGMITMTLLERARG